MSTRDKRHHSDTAEEAEAKILLEELAESAEMQQGMWPCRRGCQDPEHFHSQPGAFIERLPQEKRDILKRLKSEKK